MTLILLHRVGIFRTWKLTYEKWVAQTLRVTQTYILMCTLKYHVESYSNGEHDDIRFLHKWKSREDNKIVSSFPIGWTHHNQNIVLLITCHSWQELLQNYDMIVYQDYVWNFSLSELYLLYITDFGWLYNGHK